jgi:Ran GTPase-activating protein (RanGAP) involved in mRNA processing and transport
MPPPLSPIVKSVMEGQFEGLFKAKSRDNGVQFSEDDFKRFCLNLEKSFALGVLDLTGQRIGINVLTKLTKVLRTAPHIRVFHLYANLIRDHGINSLLQLLLANPQVGTLDIGCNDLTNQSVPAVLDIINSTRIYSLQLGTMGMGWHNNKFSLISLGDIIGALKECKRVSCLGLSGLRMSHRRGGRRAHIAEELAGFVATDPALRTLAVADSGLVGREVKILTDGLLKNDRLRHLDFHDNDLSDPVGPAFLRQLASMKKLAYFDVTNCHLSPESGAALAHALGPGSSLSFLRISGNDLGDEGAQHILSALRTNITMTEIDLSNNHFTEKCAPLLEEVITKNAVLHTIDLSLNALGDIGASAIASALVVNESLVSLNCSTCRITDQGADILAHALVRNHSLKRFKLTDNFLTRECGYVLLESIRSNETLLLFDLTATQIDHFVIQGVLDLCQRNRQIQKEVFLQPLKMQIVQLSIQRTKMPEAEIRLKSLEEERESLEIELANLEHTLETTETAAHANTRLLKNTIVETQQMINETAETVKKLAIDREKMVAEFAEHAVEIEGQCERERMAMASYEKREAEIEAQVEESQKQTETKRAELQAGIDELRALLEETIAIASDPERLRDYVPPEIPVGPPGEEYRKFFLTEQIEDLAAHESKKSTRRRKSSPGKGKKKGTKKKKKSPS